MTYASKWVGSNVIFNTYCFGAYEIECQTFNTLTCMGSLAIESYIESPSGAIDQAIGYGSQLV